MIRITRLLLQVVFSTLALLSIGTWPLVHGQTANVPFASPVLTFLGQNGQPLANGTVTSFLAGTTTPSPTYPSANTSTPNNNPLTLSAGGQAQIWLGSVNCYKFVVKNSAGGLQWSADNVCATNLGSVANIISNNCATSSVATTGFIRMCNGDLVNWRSISGAANIGFAQAGSATTATGNIADVLQYGTSSTGAFQAQRYLDFSLAPAQSGVLATGNNLCQVAARNAIGNGDVCSLLTDTSNALNLGGSAGTKFLGTLNVNSQGLTGVASITNTSASPAQSGDGLRCGNNDACVMGRDTVNSKDIEMAYVHPSGNRVVYGANTNGSTTGITAEVGTLQVDAGATVTTDVQGRRFRLTQCTHYSGADSAIVPSAGWGSTAAVSSANGCDDAFSFGLTANGSGIAATPTVVITWKDGTYTTNFPISICARNDTSSPLVTTAYVTWVDTVTTLTITFNGTPVSGVEYNFFCHTKGI